MGSQDHALINQAQDRILALERRVQELGESLDEAIQKLSNSAGSGSGESDGQFTVIRCATTSTAISAKAAGVAGSGSVVCSDIDPSSLAVSAAETLTVANFFAVIVPTATDVLIGWAPNLSLGGTQGIWVVTQRYCP